jgi:hypothetical protein
MKFLFFFLFKTNSTKTLILNNLEAFSQSDPKTKVVQNFILYNIDLGFILKLQIDFEIGI